jgi:hypothetical protein
MRYAVLLLALLAAAPATPAPKDLGVEDQELQARINAAIDRGVGHLKRAQSADGSWSGSFGRAGQTSLALFTLLSSGVRKDDPAVQKAAAFLAKLPAGKGTIADVQADRPPALRMTYAHALLVMALTELDPDRYKKAIRRSVSTLVSGQKSSGQWAYLISMGGPLDGGDNSNTQFALLALRRAARAGFRVPKQVWQRSYRHFERTLRKDGGWGYGCPGSLEGTYGSMTAVGVASLVICKAMLLGEEDAPGFAYKRIREVARGLVWLEDGFAADRHPGIAAVKPGGMPDPPGGMRVPGGFGISPQTFQYYWLYSAERVGMLLGLKYLGSHDWYREGAEWLLKEQRADGGWVNAAGSMIAPEPPLAATCFSLLFLKKATLPVVTPPEWRR